MQKINVIDGRQLKAGRVILGMTVREMAEAANINRSSVLRVESTQTLPHFAWAADKISEVLQERGICFELRDGEAGVWFLSAKKRSRKSYGTLSDQRRQALESRLSLYDPQIFL